jgi:glycosyltransferase involved in cell wall biosynthesis
MVEVSIVLPTFNRGAKLAACLQALAVQVPLAHGELEVLVVDNNSRDNTAALAQSFVARMPQRFRYVFESRQGKSNALNRGLLEACGELLLTIDDDCIAAPDWARSMQAAFDADRRLDAAGGRVLLFNQEDAPLSVRLSDYREELISTTQLFSLIGGGNFAIRRTLAERVGAYDNRLGPGARRQLGAEDIDYIYRAFRLGACIAYLPQPLVYHDHGRRTEAEIRALKRTYVEGRGAFYAKHIARGDRQILRMAWWELSACMRNALAASRGSFSRRDQLTLIAQLSRGALMRLWDEMTIGSTSAG